MNLFGLTITRQKAYRPAGATAASAVRGGWWRVLESFSGAWQRNVEVNFNSVLSHHAVFACTSLIASDIAKLRVKLVQFDADAKIWSETNNSAYSPVLTKPNKFQNRIQFFEAWIASKLHRGNTYILKRRDSRNVVKEMFVLNPDLVTPLVTPSGEVFYQLSADNVAGIESSVIVPAREIIHDRWNCLFHPLVGISPIFACGLAATQGLHMQETSANFWQNKGQPAGILLSPLEVGDDDAAEIKENWQQGYGGKNAGKIAILGGGLKYQPLTMTATDAQLIEQMRWTGEVVCSTFHVPPYKIGLGQMPTNNNVQSLNLEYYTQCLQVLIEAAELCLDEGLGMAAGKIGTEFDLDGLLRMDSVTQMDVLDKAKNILTLNERRAKLDQPAKPYGDTIYMQEQDHSAEAIAARDRLLIEQSANPPVAPTPPAAPDQPPAQERAVSAAGVVKMFGPHRKAA